MDMPTASLPHILSTPGSSAVGEVGSWAWATALCSLGGASTIYGLTLQRPGLRPCPTGQGEGGCF